MARTRKNPKEKSVPDKNKKRSKIDISVGEKILSRIDDFSGGEAMKVVFSAIRWLINSMYVLADYLEALDDSDENKDESKSGADDSDDDENKDPAENFPVAG